MSQFIESEIDFDNEEVKIIDDKKYVISYRKDEKGTIFKHTKVYNIEKRIYKLPKKVVERKHWEKFGVSKGLPPGPDKASTNRVVDEVFFEFTNNSKIKDDKESDTSLFSNKRQNVLKCKHCGGNHWSIKCSYKSDDIGKPKIEPKTDKYIPKFKRDGVIPDRNRNTLKVTNISDSADDQDIRELFYSYGRITKLYYNNKGFAYIGYDSIESCEKAIKAVNGHPYDYLILSVEMAESKK